MISPAEPIDAASIPGSIEQLSARSNLTQSQLLLWLAQALDPGAPLYNMAWRFDLHGVIDTMHFRAAFDALVRDCDALRTVFETVDGVPRQRVCESVAGDLEIVDLPGEEDCDAWIDGRVRRPLDLSACAFDAALLRLAPDRAVWYLNQHHLTTDALSAAVLLRRLGHYYEQSLGDRLHQAAAMPAFAEFREFEASQRRKASARAATEHWEARGAAATGSLEPYGSKPSSRGNRAARVELALGAERTEALGRIAGEAEARTLSPHLSLFNVFVTLLFAYLSRIGNRQALTIGAPAHNRSAARLRETVGLLVELFPLGLEVDDGETFRSLLVKVSRETRTYLRHAIPGTSSPASARSYSVVLNYLPVSFPEFAGMPVRPEWVHNGYGDPAHDLRLQVYDLRAAGDLTLAFDFNCDVFAPAQQASAVRHFEHLLDAFIRDRDQRIATTPLLSPAASRRLAAEQSRINPDFRPGPDVLARFLEQARRAPERTALVEGGREVSFAELDRLSGDIARRLGSRGVEAGARIGVCLKRSVELVAGILAAFKAGAAFVPMDPGLPARRLEFMIDDAGIRFVLVDAGTAPRLAAHAVDLIDLTPSGGAVSDPVPANGYPEGGAIGDGTPAYLIYTSGSTGSPKGVLVEHAGLAEYSRWAAEVYTGGERLRFPLYSSIGFDLTLTSIFVPLTSGGTIIIYPESGGPLDLTVLEVFEEDRVDVVKLTPSHLELVCGHELASSRVRRLIVGGEDLRVDLARRARAKLGAEVEIVNEYGPTEAVVGCMIHRFDPARDSGASVPIGVPADHTAIYLLDDDGHPVPDGVAGELCIGGPRLARGYLNQEALTAERFVPNPFDAGRIYRSGDLARRTAGGTVEYLGRIDEQVKVRGARVEPAEVEQALLEHDDVTSCTVLAVSPAPPPRPAGETRHCARCGLSSDYPGARFDPAGVCHLCRDFESYGERAQAYFKTRADLEERFAGIRRRRTGEYDCLALLSGGKDSTYVLYQLVDMGLDVLAFTLDNGFISESAKANITRVVTSLGVDHVFGSTPAMPAIFVDSLTRHANVCQGCFKTIYSLALQLAAERAIPCIVTGLSRGQLFETRLTRELFQGDEFDPEAIDRLVLEARKAYHRIDDCVTRSVGFDALNDGRILDQIEFIDFYRYADVSLDELLTYLADNAPWIRPADTGRSTNCLINDTGIYVHKRKAGYHNYALPYSWDVRLGHKQRDEALAELNDAIDVPNVYRILAQIGFDHEELSRGDGQRLAVYFTAGRRLEATEVRAFLEERVPAQAVPTWAVQLEALPINVNGKIERSELPDPREQGLERPDQPPRNDVEVVLAAVWADVLGLPSVGIHENYFDLGGDSIGAIRIVARINEAGIRVRPGDLFQHPTIAELASVASAPQGWVGGESPEAISRTSEEPFSLANLKDGGLEKLAALLNGKES